MKCKYCDNEVPDNTLICMYCGRIVQTEQERDERIRKRAEAERLEAERLEAERRKAQRLEAERLEAERLGKERQEKERLEKERLEKQRQEKLNQQQKNSTSSSGQGQKNPGNNKKKKGPAFLLVLLALIIIWKLVPVFNGEDKDTGSDQNQNMAAADTDTADAAPAENSQSSDNSTESTSNAMGTVVGKVLDEDSGAAIEGARIVLTNEEGTIFPQDDVLKSDNNGSFTTNVPGGTYTIKITKANYLEVTFGYAEVEPDETTLLGNLGIEKDSTAKNESQDTQAKDTQTQDTQSDTDEYIIPYSNTRALTDADLDHLSEWELKLARNEIYARHGRRFKDPELQSYFDKQSWYNGIYDPTDFDKNHSNELSTLEKKNAEYILQYELDHGYFT